MKRVLITGATGFIGGRLAEILAERGVPVNALVRSPATAHRLTRLPVALVPGDMLDLDSVRVAVRDCDIVVHCAVDNRAYDAADAAGHRRASKDGTANVLQAALEAGVGRVVHLSSVAVYGYEAHAGAGTEDGEYRYTGDAYCDGKIDAEIVTLDYHRRHGLPVAVLRPTIVYGPFNYWSSWLASAIRDRQMVLVDGGTGVCNQLYVDNLVDAIILAAQHPNAPGQVFHVADAVPVTWRDFLEGHARVLGDQWLPLPVVSSADVRAVQVDGQVRARVERRPPTPGLTDWRQVLARLAGRWLPAGRGRPAELSEVLDVPAIFLWKVAFSVAKAASVLGYQPRIDFATGMERTAAWMRLAGV